MLQGKNSLIFILAGAAIFCCVLSASFAILYVDKYKKIQVLQTRAASVENNRNLARRLAAEAVEYSKRNPAIDPVLQAAGLKNPPPSAKPGK